MAERSFRVWRIESFEVWGRRKQGVWGKKMRKTWMRKREWIWVFKESRDTCVQRSICRATYVFTFSLKCLTNHTDHYTLRGESLFCTRKSLSHNKLVPNLHFTEFFPRHCAKKNIQFVLQSHLTWRSSSSPKFSILFFFDVTILLDNSLTLSCKGHLSGKIASLPKV